VIGNAGSRDGYHFSVNRTDESTFGWLPTPVEKR
jgi:hypothetical protein